MDWEDDCYKLVGIVIQSRGTQLKVSEQFDR